MIQPKLLAVLLLTALAATGCRVETAGIAPTGSTTAFAPVTADEVFDHGIYCSSLGRMLEATPVGVTTDQQSADYATAIDLAARNAPGSDRDVLELLAESVRSPETMTPDVARNLFGDIAPVMSFAEDTCGLNVDLTASTSVEVTATGPSITMTTDSATTDSAPDEMPDLEPNVTNPYLPTDPGSRPERSLDVSGDLQVLADRVNSGLPKGTNGLDFTWSTFLLNEDDNQTATVLAPASWDVNKSAFGTEVSGRGSGLLATMTFDTGCQGGCVPKDWATEVMDDDDNSPFIMVAKPDELEVLVRQELTEPTGRLVVYAELDDGFFAETRVVLTRWSNEANRFFECKVTLETEARALWPVFADACLAAQPEWIG